MLPLLLHLLVLAGSGEASPSAAPARAIPPSYRPGYETIQEKDLRSWLRFIASPELGGRESGTNGFDVAARYVASVLEDSGVAPRGDGGTYFQNFQLVKRSRDLAGAALTLHGGGVPDEVISLRDQFAVSADGDPGDIDWTEPWVFVGHGEGAAWDAPDDFHGVSLAGRVALVLPPAGRRSNTTLGARLAGARRIVVIADEKVREKRGLTLPEVSEDLLPRAAALPEAAAVYITRAVADRLLARRGTSSEKLLSSPARPASFELAGLELRLRIPLVETRRQTKNVIGFIEGSDPLLRAEVVAIGAHLDHVGVVNGEVYCGADDDASGTSAVLGAARAFAANPSRPGRSLLFLFFAAEEKGLFGSRYFVDHPPVPLENIVLEVQLDMVGRNEEVVSSDPKKVEKAEDNLRSIHVVGTKRHSLELDPWIQAVNAQVGLGLEYDLEEVYSRSDQYNFGLRGIPVIFLCSGFHRDYHRPTDTPEKINFPKLLDVSRLVFSMAFEVAERPRRLKINRL